MSTSEFTHCNHFNAVTMTRKKSCPMLDKEWDGGDPCPSLTTFSMCEGMSMLKENYRRVIYVDSPLDCPWRLGECGRHGCGNYSDCDYVYARHHPCEDEGVFPEDCPLDKVDKTKASKKVMTMKTEEEIKEYISVLKQAQEKLQKISDNVDKHKRITTEIRTLEWVLEGDDKINANK